MKRNNLIVLISLIVLIIVAVILFFNNYEINDGNVQRKSSTLEVLRDFAINDTAAVNKIYLVDKDNNEVLLEREKGKWIVNDKFVARKGFVNVLLETIKRVKVANPVPKEKKDYVLRDLATNGIKCEIYQDDNLVKTYYVGGITQDNLGTYMLIEGSSDAFEVYLPGFNGYLTTRYNTSVKEWRNKQALSYKPDEIKNLEIKYPKKPEESFQIINNKGLNNYTLKSINNDEELTNFDTLAVKQLINSFRKVGFEYYLEDEYQKHHLDSLKKEDPLIVFNITDKNGKSSKLSCYKRKNIKKQLDDEGNPYKFDIERLYGVKDGEVFVMQYYILDPLSVELSELKKNNKKIVNK